MCIVPNYRHPALLLGVLRLGWNSWRKTGSSQVIQSNEVRVWLGIVPWNNLSHFTKDNQLPKLILLARLILFSRSRENWVCSNILLPIAGHGNVWFSLEKCGRVQVSLFSRVKPGVSSSILGKKKESVSCGMKNNQGSPSLLCVLWGGCENSLPLGYSGRRRCILLVVSSLLPPFYPQLPFRTGDP